MLLLYFFIFFFTLFSATLFAQPLLTFLVKHRVYKRKNTDKEKVALTGEKAHHFNALHRMDVSEMRVPLMGGLIIVLTALIGFAVITHQYGLSPAIVFVFVAGIIGFLLGLSFDIHDVYDIRSPISKRLTLVSIMGFVIGVYFYFVFNVSSIAIPFFGNIDIAFFFPLLVSLLYVAGYSTVVIDGIDGLSGSVYGLSLLGYIMLVALTTPFHSIVAYGIAILGGVVVFLWYNIKPARWYNTDTGCVFLVFTIISLALLTDAYSGGYGIALLPLIMLMPVVTIGTVVIQLISKKFRKQKIWLSTPYHHHLEAKGIAGSSVVMYYILISIVSSAFALFISVLI